MARGPSRQHGRRAGRKLAATSSSGRQQNPNAVANARLLQTVAGSISAMQGRGHEFVLTARLRYGASFTRLGAPVDAHVQFLTRVLETAFQVELLLLFEGVEHDLRAGAGDIL